MTHRQLHHALGHDLDDALTHYAGGLRGAVESESAFRVLNMMRRINDLLPHAGDAGRMQVIATLAECGIAIELMGGAPATDLVQVACRLCQANMSAKGSTNPVELAILWQVAKGFRFAATVRAGNRYDWQTDEEGRALLSRIAEISARLPPETPDESPLDEEMLMAGYAGAGDRASGDSPHQVVENLQHRYDALVNRRLQSNLNIGIDFFLTPDDIRAALDERSVLMSYYVGASPKGALAFYILLATRDDYEITMGEGEFPWSTIRLGSDGRQAEVNPIALVCSGIRSNIIDTDPYPRNISPEAVKSLDGMRQMAFGGRIPERLASLRAAGKDHLCIVAHGPLHYVPFHLMGEEDRPLADDWIVTYLPNLSLLARSNADGAGAKRARVAAFGLDFSDGTAHEGMQPLPNAPHEAREVARLFGARALVNDAATESAFLSALSTARYLHVATHGRHRVVAPSFQQILLAPDADFDGVLHAYEVLRMNLRHVDVISLSACETALGRFDSADNIRGLPASFLIAGAATVIGTLWPVQTDASERFFTNLYDRLRAGGRKLDAFRAAQRETRTAFPDYRDWGAFHFLGNI